MSDIECESVFVRYTRNNPKPTWERSDAEGAWTPCSNLKLVKQDLSGERFKCDVCGKKYFYNYHNLA